MPALFPKIPHLPGSRTGPSDRHVGLARARAFTAVARAGATVVVEEKLDGSCVVVTRVGGVIAAHGRDGKPAHLSRNLGRRLFARWVVEHERRFFSLLEDGERAAGEWLALAHGTRYALPHEPFVLFDVLRGGVGISRAALAPRAGACGFTVPCILHAGAALGVEEAEAKLGRAGHHGADEAEGVVYREDTGGVCTAVAKVVRATKVDGKHLADHTGGPHLFNTWPGRDPWLAAASAAEPEVRAESRDRALPSP